MHTILAFKRLRCEGCHEFENNPLLHSEFYTNLSYKVKSCLKKKKLVTSRWYLIYYYIDSLNEELNKRSENTGIQ